MHGAWQPTSLPSCCPGALGVVCGWSGPMVHPTELRPLTSSERAPVRTLGLLSLAQFTESGAGQANMGRCWQAGT